MDYQLRDVEAIDLGDEEWMEFVAEELNELSLEWWNMSQKEGWSK